MSLTDDITVIEGSIATIVCDVTNDHDAVGTQNVTILWFGYNGSRVNENDRISITNSSNDGYAMSFISTLSFNPVLHQDTGQYTCQAINHLVLSDNQTSDLVVESELVNERVCLIHSLSLSLVRYFTIAIYKLYY